jgi:hypothetical protein
VTALIAGFAALMRKQNADTEARAALGPELSVEALNEPRIDEAMLLARQAVRFDRSPETESALLATLQRGPAVIGTFPLPVRAQPGQLAMSPDGRTLAVGDGAGGLRLYDPRTHTLQRPPLTDYSDATGLSPVYSRDGLLLSYPTKDLPPSIVVRDAHTLKLLTKLTGGAPGRARHHAVCA